MSNNKLFCKNSAKYVIIPAGNFYIKGDTHWQPVYLS